MPRNLYIWKMYVSSRQEQNCICIWLCLENMRIGSLTLVNWNNNSMFLMFLVETRIVGCSEENTTLMTPNPGERFSST